MKKDVFVLIGPDSIDGDNVQNSHVFQAVYDTVTEKHKINEPSCCGNMTLARNPKGKDIGEWGAAITTLAEYQKAGKAEICGQCVATFYSN